MVAPIAVFGLQARGRTCASTNDAWRVRYVPATCCGMYPFAMARVGQDQLVMCIDESWVKALEPTKGQALFEAESGDAQSAFTPRGAAVSWRAFEVKM